MNEKIVVLKVLLIFLISNQQQQVHQISLVLLLFYGKRLLMEISNLNYLIGMNVEIRLHRTIKILGVQMVKILGEESFKQPDQVLNLNRMV